MHRSNGHRLWLTALLAASLIGGLAAAQTGTYLFVIPVEEAPRKEGPLGEVIDVELHVPDAATAAEIVEEGGALELLRQQEDRVIVRLGDRATLAAPPEAGHRAESFVVDFGETPVRQALDELRESVGDAPLPEALGNFVARYIDDKSYLGNFELASKVAATRSGDCTEHAVLLAALARAQDLPARVIVGVVLIETSNGTQAFGHAWNEVHSGESWQIVDATKPAGGPAVVRVRYLPFIALENEGPGYAMDLMRIAAIQPSKITLLGSASLDAI